MNNIFKIIWNKTTQRIEVVSELAKGAVKASSGSHQSKSIAIKSTLKLSLLSLCLGFTNEAMALANIDGNTTFNAPKGGVLIQDGNGKYAVGVYDKGSEVKGSNKYEQITLGRAFNIDDKLIVQTESEPRDEKGAKLTLDYSINGENLVLLPKSKNLSISKKIKNIEEVNRLKNIFLNIDNGLILRTNSEGKTEESLLEDISVTLKKVNGRWQVEK